jgi:integrase
MSCYVFRPKRKDKKTGRTVISRLYSGRYSLEGEKAWATVALKVTDKQVALEKVRRIAAEKERERYGLIPSEAARRTAATPLSQHIADFVADREKIGRAADYVRQVRAKLKLLASECAWKTPRDITPDSFLAWRTRRMDLSAKTLNEYQNAASALCSWLRRQRRGLLENPLDVIQKVSLVGQETFERRALSAEEVTRLLENCGDRSVPYMLAIYTGLRRTEIAKLQWGDVYLEGKTPSLRVRASTSKNRKTTTLPLHPRLTEELKALRANLGEVLPKQVVLVNGVPSAAQLRAAIAFQAAQHIAGETGGMQAGQHGR